MAGSRTVITPTTRPEWREVSWGQELNATRILKGSNGVTAYGEVLAGTLMEFYSDSGEYKVRPLVFQALAAAVSSSADLTMLDARNVFVGDSVEFRAGSDLFDFLSFVADADTPTNKIELTAKTAGDTGLTITLVDPSGDGSLSVAVTVGANIDVVVTLAYGTGAITSIVSDVISLLNDSAASEYLTAALASGDVDTELCIAVSEAPLVGGALAGAVLAGGPHTVSAVDKLVATVPNEVTLSSTTTVPAGYVMCLAASLELIAGVLETQPNTNDFSSGAATIVDRSVQVARAGVFLPLRLIGMDSGLTPYLIRDSLAPMAWGDVQQPFVGTFLSSLEGAV